MGYINLIVTLLAIALINQEHPSHYISSVSGDQMSQASEFWNNVVPKQNENVEYAKTKSNIDKNTLDEIISEFEELPKTNSEHNVNCNHEEQIEKASSSKRLDSTVDDIIKLIENLALIKTDFNVKSSATSEIDDSINVEHNQKELVKYPSNSDVYWRLDLDDQLNYLLYWNYNYSENYITIELKLSLDTFRIGVDLFALGLSRNEKPINADWCVLWFDNATTTMRLRSGYTNVLGAMLWDTSEKSTNPSEPFDNKCKLIASAVNENKLTILYQRPLDPCEQSGYKIDNGTTHVVWFKLTGPVDNIDDLRIDSLTQQHRTMEQNFKRVQLLSAISTSIPAVKREAKSFSKTMRANAVDNVGLYYRRYLSITNDKLAVPSSETTYWCKMFKLPKDILHNKHHVTRYEAIIEKGNEHLVHHMELFHCEFNEHETVDPLVANWSGLCSGENRPKQTESCKRVILAWAMGATPLHYPKEVGQPIGGKHYNPYLMLEVHYNNVNKRSDIIDSSGLRLYYTNQLRQFDAGVIEVGLEYTEKNSIPPNVIAPLIGYCVSECTRVGLSTTNDGVSGGRSDGINIFAAQLHTHLTGISSWTQIMRGNKIIGELNRDNHYSPHFQEIRLLPEPVKLLPGDALIHYCLYNTKNRVNITLGGYAITDEMCVTYLHYYPKVQLEVCKSSIDTNALKNYFRQLAEDEYQNVNNWQNNSVTQNYLSIQWNPLRATKLLSLYKESPLSVQCNKSNGDRFPGNWNGIWPPHMPMQAASAISLAQNQSQFIESAINEKLVHVMQHPKCNKNSND